MLPDPDAARVVDGICDGGRDAADGRFAETLDSVVPARLQAVDEDLGLLGNVHDGGEPVRQITDAVVTRTGKFPIPGKGSVAIWRLSTSEPCMSASATSGFMTRPVSWQYTALMNRQSPVHVSTSTSAKQPPKPLTMALPPVLAMPRPC